MSNLTVEKMKRAFAALDKGTGTRKILLTQSQMDTWLALGLPASSVELTADALPLADQLRADLGIWGTSVTFTDAKGVVTRVDPADYFAHAADEELDPSNKSA